MPKDSYILQDYKILFSTKICFLFVIATDNAGRDLTTFLKPQMNVKHNLLYMIEA